jgi:hypothetical protein
LPSQCDVPDLKNATSRRAGFSVKISFLTGTFLLKCKHHAELIEITGEGGQDD